MCQALRHMGTIPLTLPVIAYQGIHIDCKRLDPAKFSLPLLSSTLLFKCLRINANMCFHKSQSSTCGMELQIGQTAFYMEENNSLLQFDVAVFSWNDVISIFWKVG